MEKKVAAIDIGTNSVLLTIAEIDGEKAEPIYESAIITRIGEGLTTTGTFGSDAINRTLVALQDYSNICQKKSVDKIFIVGTEAMRRASNANAFIREVKKRFGLEIKIISGEREAELSFKAAEKDFGPDLLVVDIGGGSTELISKQSSGELRCTSFQIGSVSTQEKYCKSDPINNSDLEGMINYIRAGFTNSSDIGSGITRLVATAGTATTLAAMKLRLVEYSHSQVHGWALTRNDVQGIIDELKIRTIEERKQLPGLEPKRADVILPGGLILLTIMDKYGFKETTVSDRGVRWGIIYEQLSGTLGA
jgi:exopolyphosphatase/guanosine-5'-triphosphate,3'-diphosphate pyrophosphatase